MELRRTCKQKYAALSAGEFCDAVLYRLYSLSICAMREIRLDILSIYGIIVLTHKAVA
jgi:hypothetical protein